MEEKFERFKIVAVDKNNNIVSISKVIHVSTKGSKKKANPTKVAVKKAILTKAKSLKKGSTLALKATAKKAKKTKVVKHTAIRYESSNTKVATVTSKGKVKAIKKGTAKIYCYAQNGKVKIVAVRVK